MLFTLVGIEIDLRADPEKVYALIEVILLGILAFVSEVHSKNAYSKTEVTPEAKAVHGVGIDAYFPIVRGACSLADAMDNANARRNMADSVEQALRLIKKYEQGQ